MIIVSIIISYWADCKILEYFSARANVYIHVLNETDLI